MRKSKHGLGLAGLMVVAALSVMAFASSAQAAVEPSFYVNGSNANLPATLGGEQIAASVNVMLVAALGVEVKCPEFEVVTGNLENNKKASGKLLFKNCKWFELAAPLGEIASCHIITAKGGTQLHITATGTILPTELDNGSYAVLVENISALIFNEEGKGCVLPTDNVVTGEVCLKLGTNHSNPLLLITNATIQGECVPKVLNALGDPAGTKVRDTLKYGAQAAILDAHVNVFLTGEHAGKTLGVLLP